ncbi:Hsp20/alpha crystallin family protein [Candidatus Nomurabacteria bacterium]|nr:Hsp20/alpha crystallin family protein [Candidatus Nomurabacteria bacterium]
MFNKKKKKSFLERITGSVHADHFDDYDDDDFEDQEEARSDHSHENSRQLAHNSDLESFEESVDGQLAVDVFNTEDSIIIKAMIAGVRPGDLDIDISRDMVTIHGSREESHEITHDNYYHRELYWGSFSRNILLPEEVDVDLAEAAEKNGLLTISLPKLDKNRKTKLHVKSK